MVSIKTTELQQLLEASGNLKINVPTTAWKIRDDRVEMKASDLQDIFKQSFENIGNVPESPWNIRDSAANYRNALKEQELRNLFSSGDFNRPQAPATPWKIRPTTASLKEAKMEELKELLSRARFNDKVPDNKWNIRQSSLRFKNSDDDNAADELTAPVPQTPLTKAVAGSGLLTREQQTYLQQILEDHGLMPKKPDLENKWNIRESGEKFRKVKFKIHAALR